VAFGGWTLYPNITGLKPAAWRVLMSSCGYAAAYPSRVKFMLRSITHGADINFRGRRDIVRECRNPASTEDPIIRELMSAKIQKDVAAGKKLGPYASPPFRYYWVSPIRGVLKEGKKIRVVHNLSYPHGGESVNTGIPDEPCELARFDDATDAIRRMGRGCFLIKLDVEAAYKQVPVRFEDWCLLIFKWMDMYYIDITLPMGLKPSCMIWEYYATALEWIFKRCLGIEVVVHYIDDFLFVVKLKETGVAQLRRALQICERLGLPMAVEKTEGPTTRLTFLGIEIDTEAMMIRLPEEQLLKLNQLLSTWENKTRASKSDLRSLSGYLNFICKVVRAGRTFARRIIDHSNSLKGKPQDNYPLSEEVQQDIRWWKNVLPTIPSHSVLYEAEWAAAPLMELFTDACDEYGYGACYQGKWFKAPWTAAEIEYSLREHAERKSRSMPFLEMLGLLYAVASFGRHWQGKKITFRSDCLPVVQAIEKGSTNKRKLMQLLRHLHALAAQYSFEFRCVHVKGADNSLADALSRDDVQKFFRLCQQSGITAEPRPEVIATLPPFDTM
jgi:hypothetical protein